MGWIARPRLARRRGTLMAGLTLGLVFAVAVSAAAVSAQQSARMQSPAFLRTLKDVHRSSSFWAKAAKPRRAARQKAALSASKVRAYRLNTARLKSVLARAPRERTTAARTNPLVVSLPAPNGTFNRFVLQQSAIMAPGLAKRHPEIKTYSGRGITDPTATIHADLSPLGFHASVRSAQGRHVVHRPVLRRPEPERVRRATSPGTRGRRDGVFVERDAGSAELSVDEGYYHASDTVTVNGSGFDANAGDLDHDQRPGGELRDADRDARPRTGSARSRRASSRIPTATSRRTSSRRATAARRPRRATRSCATTIRPATRRPATSSGTTGWR